MNKLKVIEWLFRQADAIGSKSTTMNPLSWIILILISAICISFYFGFPIWASKIFLIFLGLAIIIYFIAYIYFMRRDPEYLRTEKFVLRKKEIEKGYIGDNLSGLIEPSKQPIEFIEDKSGDKS